MKKILLLLLFFVVSFHAFAEKENYIILFDCTASMKGSEGGPNVWEDAKSILAKSVLNINGAEAKIVVIPFQDKIGNVTEFYASDKSKTNIVNQILKDVDKMIGAKHRGTSICRAWDLGLKYLEEDCFNFMMLMTDGADNIELKTGNPARLDKKGQPITPEDAAILEACTQEVCNRVREWCGSGVDKVMSYCRLTQGAQLAKIEDTVKEKDCKNTILADGMNLSLLNKRDFVFNVLDFKSDAELKVALRLNNSLSGKAVVKTDSDLFDLSLGKGGFINGAATLCIHPKVDYHALRARVGQKIVFKARIEPENPEDLTILLDELSFTVIGDPERVLSVNQDCNDLGRATHYQKFLWKKASEPDTLYTRLSFDFNEYAEDADSRVTFNVSSTEGDFCEFYIDGKNVSSFVVNSDSEVEIGVVFKPESPEGYYGIEIVAARAGVDRIGNASIEDGDCWKSLVYGTYKIRTNPLKIALVSLLIFLVALFLLWVLFLRYLFFPRFKISLIFAGHDEKTMVQKRVKGFIRFVITSSPKRQSGFMNLLTGKVQYLQMLREDGVVENIVIEPFDKRSVRICKSPKGSYLITYPRLRISKVGQSSEVSEVINQQSGKSIKIKIQ